MIAYDDRLGVEVELFNVMLHVVAIEKTVVMAIFEDQLSSGDRYVLCVNRFGTADFRLMADPFVADPDRDFIELAVERVDAYPLSPIPSGDLLVVALRQIGRISGIGRLSRLS